MWTDIIDYYQDKLIVQYKSKPKMQDTVAVLVDCSICEGLPLQLQTIFNLDTAFGAQLDIIGRIVGVPREVIGLDLAHDFFSFTRYSGTPASVGFGRYAWPYDPGTNDIWLRYKTTAYYVMTDFEMLTAIKLAIIYNNNHETYYGVKGALYKAFQGGIDVNKGATVMTVIYTVNSIYKNAILVMQFLGLLPAPMGVSTTITYV